MSYLYPGDNDSDDDDGGDYLKAEQQHPREIIFQRDVGQQVGHGLAIHISDRYPDSADKAVFLGIAYIIAGAGAGVVADVLDLVRVDRFPVAGHEMVGVVDIGVYDIDDSAVFFIVGCQIDIRDILVVIVVDEGILDLILHNEILISLGLKIEHGIELPVLIGAYLHPLLLGQPVIYFHYGRGKLGDPRKKGH